VTPTITNYQGKGNYSTGRRYRWEQEREDKGGAPLSGDPLRDFPPVTFTANSTFPLRYIGLET
jgi:hypothetical protein